MIKIINVGDTLLHVGDIIITTHGKARLDYIGRQSFTCWTLLEQVTDIHLFGKSITIEDNELDTFCAVSV